MTEPGGTPGARTVSWTPAVEYSDIRFETSGTGIARVTINRPEVRNAFRPETVNQLIDAFARIRDDAIIGCVRPRPARSEMLSTITSLRFIIRMTAKTPRVMTR